jgi:hypothetical protein
VGLALLDAIMATAEEAGLAEKLGRWTRWARAVRAGVYHRASAAEAIALAGDVELERGAAPDAWIVRAAVTAAAATLCSLDNDLVGARSNLCAAQALIESPESRGGTGAS